MPCQDALISNPICVNGSDTIEVAMDMLEEKGLRTMPVLDAAGHLIGMFGMQEILNYLLPISARMVDGIPNLGFLKGSAPGVAKRLFKIKKEHVSSYMVPFADLQVVYPETPVWEVIRMIVKHGSPLVVIEPDTKNFYGLVSEQSILANIQELLEEMEKTPEQYFRP